MKNCLGFSSCCTTSPTTPLSRRDTEPFWWDGSDETLPDGIDATNERIFAQLRANQPVNALYALAAECPQHVRHRGLAVQSSTGCARLRSGMDWFALSEAPLLGLSRPRWSQ